VHFDRLIGKEMAMKMLHDDYKLGADEALRCNFVTKVTPHDQLLEAAQALAEERVREARPRSAMGFTDFENLRAINVRESEDLARAFLSYKFLNNQYIFLSSKGKTLPAAVFKSLAVTHPIWSRFA
jgi:enoyl-CoA hydratase/carnithine racemase